LWLPAGPCVTHINEAGIFSATWQTKCLFAPWGSADPIGTGLSRRDPRAGILEDVGLRVGPQHGGEERVEKRDGRGALQGRSPGSLRMKRFAAVPESVQIPRNPDEGGTHCSRCPRASSSGLAPGSSSRHAASTTSPRPLSRPTPQAAWRRQAPSQSRSITMPSTRPIYWCPSRGAISSAPSWGEESRA